MKRGRFSELLTSWLMINFMLFVKHHLRELWRQSNVKHKKCLRIVASDSQYPVLIENGVSRKISWESGTRSSPFVVMILYIKRVHMQKFYERLERLRNLERFSLDSKYWMPLQTCPWVCRVPGIQEHHEKWSWFLCHRWRGSVGRCWLLRSAEHVQRNESNNRFGLLEVRSALSGAARIQSTNWHTFLPKCPIMCV